MSWMESYLQRFDALGGQAALVDGNEVVGYAELARRTRERAAELAAAGVARRVAALRADFGAEAIVTLLALLHCGNTVPLVPVHAGGQACLDAARPHWVLSASERFAPVATGAGAPDSPLLAGLLERGRPGLVIFTSGSTGVPKASLYDAESILVPQRTGGRALRTLPLLMLDHIGGINALATVFARGAVLVAPAARTPAAVVRTVATHGVEAIVTSPTFLNLLLLSGALREAPLPTLRVVNYSGERMPEATLAALQAALPHVRLSQAFGSTETGVLPMRSAARGGTRLALHGDGCTLRVRDGMLEVKTPRGMLGYLHGDAPLTPDGFFRTGDAVEVEPDGSLRILGRRSEQISVGSEKFFPAEVEDVLRELPGVIDAVARGEPNPLTGQVVAATFWLKEPEPLGALRQRVYQHCKDRLPTYKIPRLLEITTEPLYNARLKRIRHGHA